MTGKPSPVDDGVRELPILTRDQEVQLASGLVASRHEFALALSFIPGAAEEAVRIWHQLLRTRRVTGKMSQDFPGRDNDRATASTRLDDSMKRLERATVQLRDVHAAPPIDGTARAQAEARLSRALTRANLSSRVLDELRVGLAARQAELDCLASEDGTSGRQGKTRREEIERDVGLATAVFVERFARVERALSELTSRRNLFARHNLRLVFAVVGHLQHRAVPFIDLVQEGSLGLLRAVDTFDPRRGFKFSTYAVWWIRQSALRAIQSFGGTIRIPGHLQEEMQRCRRSQQRLQHELGRSVSIDELAQRQWVSPRVADLLGGLARGPARLDERLVGHDELRLLDTLADPDAPEPSDGPEARLLKRALEAALSILTPREQQILRWRYGFDDHREQSLAEIGRRLSLSRERVRQLQAGALRRLRKSGLDLGSLRDADDL